MQRCASAAGQKREAENRGCRTMRAARPQRRQHGVALRIGVIERHRDEVHVVLAQLLVRGTDARPPQCIGVGPEHRLRTGRGAGGVLHAEGRGRIGGTWRQARQGLRPMRRNARWRRVGPAGASPQSVSVTATNPRPGAASDSSRAKFRLRDRANGAGMGGEIREFVGAGSRVRRDGDGSEECRSRTRQAVLPGSSPDGSARGRRAARRAATGPPRHPPRARRTRRRSSFARRPRTEPRSGRSCHAWRRPARAAACGCPGRRREKR